MGAKDIDYDFVVEKYWDTNPAWSGIDLAKYYDCDWSTIYRFMKKNDIPRRNHSEANLNKWLCKWKREANIKSMKEKDGKRRSEFMKERWEKPEFREMMIKNNTEIWDNPEYREHLTKIVKDNYYNNPNNPLRLKNENQLESEED